MDRTEAQRHQSNIKNLPFTSRKSIQNTTMFDKSRDSINSLDVSIENYNSLNSTSRINIMATNSIPRQHSGNFKMDGNQAVSGNISQHSVSSTSLNEVKEVEHSEKSINNIKKERKAKAPKKIEVPKKYPDLKENIISNGGSLGVQGIDIPISGSLSNKGRNNLYYTVDQNNLRNDRLVTQVSVSDMVNKIK